MEGFTPYCEGTNRGGHQSNPRAVNGDQERLHTQDAYDMSLEM